MTGLMQQLAIRSDGMPRSQIIPRLWFAIAAPFFPVTQPFGSQTSAWDIVLRVRTPTEGETPSDSPLPP